MPAGEAVSARPVSPTIPTTGDSIAAARASDAYRLGHLAGMTLGHLRFVLSDIRQIRATCATRAAQTVAERAEQRVVALIEMIERESA